MSPRTATPLLLLLGSVASAAPAAYYHPDSVAEKSTLFADSAKKSGDAFDKAQQSVGRLGAALEDLEAGVGFLGSDIPPGFKSWAEQTRKLGLGQFLVVQHFLDALQDDYSGAFEEALERALPTVAGSGGVAVCKASGPRMGPGGGGGARTCEGQDLNAALARAIDADATLKAKLDEIMSRTWPTVSIQPAPQPVVALTGTTRWASAAALTDAFLEEREAARQEALDDALAGLEERIDAQDAAAIAEAGRLKDAYLAGLGQDGAALRAAATEALARAAKKGTGPAEVGVCANPVALGGCPGENATEATLAALTVDKKLPRTLEAYFHQHPVAP
jgi:hypothetical protein